MMHCEAQANTCAGICDLHFLSPESEAASLSPTAGRYTKKAMIARRTREGVQERLCAGCQRYTFDALRCGRCKSVYYCSRSCQVGKEDRLKHHSHNWFCPVQLAAGVPLILVPERDQLMTTSMLCWS